MDIRVEVSLGREYASVTDSNKYVSPGQRIVSKSEFVFVFDVLMSNSFSSDIILFHMSTLQFLTSFWIEIRFDIFFTIRMCFEIDLLCRKSFVSGIVIVFVET